MSWNPEVSDPTAYLKPLFHSTAVQQSNWSRFAFRGFDYQLDHEANQKQEPSDRRTEILAAENLLCGSMPMIPVAQGGFAYAVRQQRVGSAAGRFTDQATGALLLRELYVKAP
jgi:ABC-type oligopeptide transport system substrate-binding subunit